MMALPDESRRGLGLWSTAIHRKTRHKPELGTEEK
jgi:hypothetical protein